MKATKKTRTSKPSRLMEALLRGQGFANRVGVAINHQEVSA